MQGKDKSPNLEKKTTISFPLKKPEPITVPTMESTANIHLYIVLSYDKCHKWYSTNHCHKRRWKIDNKFILHTRCIYWHEMPSCLLFTLSVRLVLHALQLLPALQSMQSMHSLHATMPPTFQLWMQWHNNSKRSNLLYGRLSVKTHLWMICNKKN